MKTLSSSNLPVAELTFKAVLSSNPMRLLGSLEHPHAYTERLPNLVYYHPSSDLPAQPVVASGPAAGTPPT